MSMLGALQEPTPQPLECEVAGTAVMDVGAAAPNILGCLGWVPTTSLRTFSFEAASPSLDGYRWLLAHLLNSRVCSPAKRKSQTLCSTKQAPTNPHLQQ